MGKNSNVTVLIGAQWGDEGKGKWIDVLAEKADLVVRYQGGNNAGHTLYIDGEKFVLHQIPSGVFHPTQKNALAAGVVINPGQLVTEIEKLRGKAKVNPERLWLSARAHVITPWHIHLDEQKEASAKKPIGTTKRGIGPTYSEKAARTGLRLGHFVDKAARTEWITTMSESVPGFAAHLDQMADTWKTFFSAGETLAPFVCDAEAKIRAMAADGKTLLLEGAQGSLLDIDHGTYPYVTSSSTGVGGACQSIGLSPKFITRSIGIAKGYATRVGEGPFPSELFDDVGRKIAEKGKEFGATTNRPRRCGWFDAVAMRYVVAVNGLDGICLNKIDILSGIGDIKVCVAYRHPTLGDLTELPWDTRVLSQITPVYQSFPGWNEDISGINRLEELPLNCRNYIKAVEDLCKTKIMMVGTGPNRTDTIFCV
jgi:adenylosuccinate synthase